jgi:manganese-dependent inorganic pyrophosphatase
MGGTPLAGETIQSFGEQLLMAGAGLAARDPAEIVSTDFKQYETAEQRFGISQVEVTSFNQLDEHLDSLRKALADLAASKGLDFAMLMVTDVVRSSSRLLLTKTVPALEVLPYPHQDDGTLYASGVVSRKKQLLPAVFSALEG